MTKRATAPISVERSKKREDTTPKPKLNASHGSVAQARRGRDTSTNAGCELIDVNKPLTDKQRLFVKYWAEGESISSASARAGYADSGTLAYRMIKMPNVLALYQSYKAQYEEAGQMTREKVMDMLKESYDMAKLMAEPASMVGAAREIGKMCGYYAPVETRLKVDVNGNPLAQRLNSLSDADLLKLITGKGPLPQLPGPGA
jgi:hypothetical protein